jgi:hypothetical protein
MEGPLAGGHPHFNLPTHDLLALANLSLQPFFHRPELIDLSGELPRFGAALDLQDPFGNRAQRADPTAVCTQCSPKRIGIASDRADDPDASDNYALRHADRSSFAES